MNVLIVDDAKINRMVLCGMVQQCGEDADIHINIFEAGSGEEALKIDEKMDLVFTDYAMDGMDGSEYIKRLYDEYERRGWDMPLTVAISGDSEAATRVNFKGNVGGYLCKPIHKKDVALWIVVAADN